ncbi:MAG TPA: capsule assembly Wzi family protein, partial [Steroidobacteraceae bacterium]
MRFPFTILSDRTRHLALMLLLLAGLAIESPVHARGVSPYLPMNMAPEIERDIERVLILADQAVTRRPFAAAAVLDALPHACRIDISLCRRVREYLNGYMRTAGLNHAGVEGGSSDVSSAGRPNQRGMFQGDDWSASVQAYWQPGDFFLVQLGGMAYPGEATPAGSWVSVGSEYVQLDIGYREHWWSPMTDSSMLVSTNAQPMPGVTLSNYTPISRLGVRYEIFAARMSRVDDIYYQGGQATGNPRLAGLHVSIEPVPGWSLSASRLLQFGGGPRGASFRDFLRAFLKPTKYDNISDELSRDEQFGNQIAAFSTRMVFPGATPFSVYFEYAGEDGSRLEGWRLGNAALSAGIDIPYLWNRFDFTYEISDWQNGWYVNNVYPQGTSNHGRVIGHWGA